MRSGCNTSGKKKSAGTFACALNKSILGPGQDRLDPLNRIPRSSGLQLVVNIIDVLHSFSLEPLAEGGRTLLRINRDSIFPCRTSAQHAIEFHSRFSCQLQRLAELSIAHTRRKINERLGRNVRRLVEEVNRFLLRICFLPSEALYPFDKFHIHGNFDLQYVHAIAVFAEFPHALADNLRFLLGVLQTLFVSTFLVSDKLQEVRDVIRPALVTNALNPGMFLVVYFLGIEGRVVEQNLDTVRSGLLQTPRRPVIKQVAQTPGA